MDYIKAEILRVRATEADEIGNLSRLATRIVRQHFDSIVGTEQNDYMLQRFQTPRAIRQQLQEGYRYYWVMADGQAAGFLAFLLRDEKLYLSKFYIAQEWRGHHLAQQMHAFVCDEARRQKLPAIFLNVNRDNTDVIAIYEHLGFRKIREEKNDIGNGFFMDDFVMEYRL